MLSFAFVDFFEFLFAMVDEMLKEFFLVTFRANHSVTPPDPHPASTKQRKILDRIDNKLETSHEGINMNEKYDDLSAFRILITMQNQ
jgi:hypothetical protein